MRLFLAVRCAIEQINVRFSRAVAQRAFAGKLPLCCPASFLWDRELLSNRGDRIQPLGIAGCENFAL